MGALYDHLTELFRDSCEGYALFFINLYAKFTAVLTRPPFFFSGSSGGTISLAPYSVKETARHFT